jgi:hypothetical protein
MGRDLVEQRRRHEHAVGELPGGHGAAAHHHLGPLLTADAQVFDHLVVLSAMDDRAGVGRLLPGRPAPERLDALRQARHKGLVL